MYPCWHNLIYPKVNNQKQTLPARLGDNHLRPERVELIPQVFGFQRHFGIVFDPIVFRGLEAPHQRGAQDVFGRQGRLREQGRRGQRVEGRPWQVVVGRREDRTHAEVAGARG